MQSTYRPVASALWMSGAIASFTAMAIAGRAVAGVHDTFEIMMWRSAIGLALVLGIGTAAGRLGEIRTDRLPSHLVRNLCHFTGQNLWFWSLTMIPLAQVFALEFTSPLWVLLFSTLFLGERLTRLRLAAAAIGFCGILLVARPDVMHLNPGVLAAAGCAVFFAATMIMTKVLTRDESIISILFWLTVMQFVLGLGMALSDGRMAFPTAATLPWLALIGGAGVLAHLCLTTALSLAPASFVAPLDFTRLPVIAAVGALAYGEAVETAVLLGGGLIFAANWLNLRASSKTAKAQ